MYIKMLKYTHEATYIRDYNMLMLLQILATQV